MVIYHSIALIMIGVAWRTPRLTCSASFISIHRHSAAHEHYSNKAWSLSSASLHCASSQGRNIDSPANSHSDASVHSRDFLRLSRERPLCTATTLNKKKPLTWTRLLELFRDPATPEARNSMYIPSGHPNLALFRRSFAAQKSYEQHKEYLNSCWKSAYDYLVVSKFGERFGFDKVLVSRDASLASEVVSQIEKSGDIPPKGHLYQSSPSLAQASRYALDNQTTYLSLAPNDFPYDVDEGIEHWCLWKIGGACNAESISMGELTWALQELKSSRAHDSGGRGCIIHRDGRTFDKTDFVSRTLVNDVGVRRIGAVLDALYWVNPPHLQSMPEIHHAHILALRSDEKCNDLYSALCPPPV
jgi:hypothetical protein